MRLDIEDMVAEGEKVLARLTIHSTHRGELLGFPLTGRAPEVGRSTCSCPRRQARRALGPARQLGMLRKLDVTSI